MIDVASRCIVGYVLSFSGPNACTAIETLKSANAYNRVPHEQLEQFPVLERINCQFETLLVDRGSNYRSHAFGQALLDIGTTLKFARVRRPRDKGIVERVFYTLKTYLLEKLPGATLDPKLMREFGYDPEKDAVLTISELRELIEFFIAVYHLTIHSTIGMQPALFWTRSMATHGRRLMADAPRFGILVGETITGVQMHRWGFTLDGIRYTHPVNVQLANDALAGSQKAGTEGEYLSPVPGHGRRSTGRRRKERRTDLGNNEVSCSVKVKRNRANLGRVHAFVPGNGWLEYEAANFAYADGLSLDQHQQIKKWAKNRNMAFSTEGQQLAARAALVAHIEKLASSMSLRERRAVARMTDPGLNDDHRDAPVVLDEDAVGSHPCEDRDDPAPANPRRHQPDGDGNTMSEPSKAEAELREMLTELQALGLDDSIPDDEQMEEFA